MSEFVPTEEQSEIIEHPPDTHGRILAGPGTGKSVTLVALTNRLIQTRRRIRIRLLTFTRAATAELAKVVAENSAAVAERPSTIHSFSISVLLRNPGVGGFPEPLRIADDWEDDEVIRPTLAQRAGVSQNRLKILLRELASNWESLTEAQDPLISADERSRFMGAWYEHRQVLGYTLLAELPYALRNALTNHQDLEGCNYDLLVVDEYQDLNACDLEVIRLMAARGSSILGAGDDDQSIYSFRKAAPEGIRRFVDDYSGARDYPLSRTRRCGRRIVAWARYVIEGDPDRPARPPLTAADQAPDGETALLSFPDENNEARGVARLVKHLIEDEGVSATDILILVRSNYRGQLVAPLNAHSSVRGFPMPIQMQLRTCSPTKRTGGFLKRIVF